MGRACTIVQAHHGTWPQKKHTDPVEKVPAEYHEFLDVFSRKEPDKLPEHRPYDHKINLKPGKPHHLVRWMECPWMN